MRLTKTEKAAVAVLFASGEPIPVSRLAQVFDCLLYTSFTGAAG